MDCVEIEELLAPYALGALEPRERKRLEAHLALCSKCSTEYRAYSETAASLARVMPKESPRPVLKAKVMHEIGRPGIRQVQHVQTDGASGLLTLRQKISWLPLNTYSLAAAVLIIAIGVVSVSIWFDHRLNALAVENQSIARRMTQQDDSLSSRIQQVAFRSDDGIDRLSRQGAWLVDVAQQQRAISYLVATPGMTVHLLQASDTASKARGMFMVGPTNKYAILAVLQMEPLPQDKVYQVWLLRGTQRDDGGYFRTDSTGYGQISINAGRPISDYSAIGITLEPAGGSPWPTGTKVMGGDVVH